MVSLCCSVFVWYPRRPCEEVPRAVVASSLRRVERIPLPSPPGGATGAMIGAATTEAAGPLSRGERYPAAALPAAS